MRLTTNSEASETLSSVRREPNVATSASSEPQEQSAAIDSARPILETAIDYTRADFSRYYTLVSGAQRSSDVIFSCGFATVVLLYAAVNALLHHNYGATGAFAVFGLTFLYWAAYPIVAPRRALKRWKNAVPAGAFRVTIGENGIRTLGAYAEGTYNWSYFNLAWEDTKLFGVTDCEQTVVIIPRRCLSAEQTNALRALFQRQVPWWADSDATRRGKLRNMIRQVRKQAKSAAKAANKSA